MRFWPLAYAFQLLAQIHTLVSLLSLLLFAGACSAQPQRPVDTLSATPTAVNLSERVLARVVNIVDGATIDVDVGGQLHTVRYLGVEIPGGNLSGDSGPISERTAEFNRFLVARKTVELVSDALEADHFGNLLRYVYVDGEMVNETLITNGYATVAHFPPSFQFQTAFLLAEENARANMRGLWEAQASVVPAEVPRFGSTLPPLPTTDEESPLCDYSGTSDPVLKGTTDPKTGERIYYIPGRPGYAAAMVVESRGGRWFCTEEEALAAGWTSR